LSDEKVKRGLEEWEARVKEWVAGKVVERDVGFEKGEMEMRRERVERKEASRGSQEVGREGVGRISQEEIEEVTVAESAGIAGEPSVNGGGRTKSKSWEERASNGLVQRARGKQR